ncbi:MAG TPA: hypothetical protein VJ814_11245 [Gaiellaceae bacterium]|nr:hypothetical protein [Gaiellaceae bacterium]
MAATGPLARTPYFSFGRRPYREERLAAYIHREHRNGRRVSEILQDAYVARCGGDSVVRAVLRRRDLIEALERDVAEAIAQSRP